jgi:hypothetical protein
MADSRARPNDTAPTAAAENLAGLAVEDAREAGLLEGEKTVHLSFRLPIALLEAARRETGLTSKTELGIAAVSMLARPDPAVAFQVANFGALGVDFDLEY